MVLAPPSESEPELVFFTTPVPFGSDPDARIVPGDTMATVAEVELEVLLPFFVSFFPFLATTLWLCYSSSTETTFVVVTRSAHFLSVSRLASWMS